MNEPLFSFTLPLPLVVALLVSTVLPLLVGLVSKSTWSAAAKATLLAVLASVTGLLTELGDALATGTTYDLGLGLLVALGGFLVAVGLHFGIYSRPDSSGESVSSRLVAIGSPDGPAHRA